METKQEGALTPILEQIQSAKYTKVEVEVQAFIKTLDDNGITHMCLFAEDDYAEVPVMYYAFIRWGSCPISPNEEYFMIKSPKGYKVLYKYFRSGAVEFMPEIIDGNLIS